MSGAQDRANYERSPNKTNKMKNIIAIIAVIGGVAILVFFGTKKGNMLGSTARDSYSITSNTTTSVTRAPVTVAALTNPHALIQNQATSSVYCMKEGGTTAASSSATSTAGNAFGFILTAPSSSPANPDSRWESDGYVGNINCTCASNGCQVYVEKE